jgi:hypothetical protein
MAEQEKGPRRLPPAPGRRGRAGRLAKGELCLFPAAAGAEEGRRGSVIRTFGAASKEACAPREGSPRIEREGIAARAETEMIARWPYGVMASTHRRFGVCKVFAPDLTGALAGG